MADNILDSLTAPEEPEDDRFDISAQIMKKFGQNFTPEQRLKLQEEANRRKLGQAVPNAIAQFAAGMRGKPGDADEGIRRKMLSIDDETTGDFDRQREQAVKDYVLGQKTGQEQVKFGQQNELYGQAQEERAEGRDPNAPLADDAREMISWVGAKLGMKPAQLEGMGIEQLKAHPLYDKAADLYIKEKMANRPGGISSQYGPGAEEYFKKVNDIARGLLPPDTELPTENVGPRGLKEGAGMLGSRFGKDRTQARWETPRSTALENVNNLKGTLVQLDSLEDELPGFDSGFLKTKANMAKWYFGIDDPNIRAQMKSKMGLLLAQYIKSVSGAAVTDVEAQRLQGLLPGELDDEDTLFTKFTEFRKWNIRNLNSTLGTYEGDGSYKFPGTRKQIQERGWTEEADAEPAADAQPAATAEAVPASAAVSEKVRFQVNGKNYGFPATDTETIARFKAKYPDAVQVP